MTAKNFLQRRRLIKGSAALGTASFLGLPALARAQAADPWARAREIADVFAKPLAFPKRDFLVTAFGARPCKVHQVAGYPTIDAKGQVTRPVPGSHDSHPALRAAIAAAHKAGGGR
ncbi:MAG TPA: endopolygalacturonase, partial [Pseudoduganella sp.]